MYGLPPDQDFGFLIGVTLTQICIGRHEIILNFSGDVSITVEGDLEIEPTLATRHRYDDSRVAGAKLSPLVALSVENARRIQPGDLELTFSNGWAVNICDSSSHYESYQIRHGSDLFVI